MGRFRFNGIKLLDKQPELGTSVVSGVEAGNSLRQIVAEDRKVGPSVVSRRGLDDGDHFLLHLCHIRNVANALFLRFLSSRSLCFRGSRRFRLLGALLLVCGCICLCLAVFLLPAALRLPVLLIVEDVQEFERLAGRYQRRGCLLFAHADDGHAGFPKSQYQLRKITVRCHDAETIYISRIENVHGVNDQCGIRRILSMGVVILEYRRDRIFLHIFHPRLHAGYLEISIQPLVGRRAVVAGLIKNQLNVLAGDILRIDQHRDPLFLFRIHVCGVITPFV